MTDSPHNHNVVIRPGSNSWLMQRTDRDDAERSTVIESTGAFLNRVLNHASPAGLRGIFQQLQSGPTGGRFVIGAARPILVTANDQRPTRPDELLTDCSVAHAGLPLNVSGRRPWFVTALFEWHGGRVVLPWPKHFGPVLGSELTSDVALDWLLLESHKAVTP